MNKVKNILEETAGIIEKTPVEEINDHFLRERKISLLLKREDLNHQSLSGNKWHKLKYNIQEAKNLGKKTLLTFGGAYSNHIYATAAIGKIFNFQTIGIIRGEGHLPLNPTLSFAVDNGMKLHYMERALYRRKDSIDVIQILRKRFGDFYLIPEGGTNQFAVKGCSEIINTINEDFDYICCACGTGGTLAGLIAGLNGKKIALGFAVLKGASFMRDNVSKLLRISGCDSFKNWDINLDYHFGGYAKIDSTLVNFVNNFYATTKIAIEPIYTGKMLFGVYDLVSKSYFKPGTRILALHTGGLQGLKGLQTKIKANHKFEFSAD